MLELLVGIWVVVGIVLGVVGFLVLWIAFASTDDE